MRENNEDFILGDTDRGIFLLADGMGGQPGGEVASRVAVGAAYRLLADRFSGTRDDEVPRLLAEAFAVAHAAVFKEGVNEPELAGLGTTLDAVVLRGAVGWCCHVGDGRIYLFGRRGTERLSIDDNYAAALARKGANQEVIPKWARHILTQAVGITQELYPEIREMHLAKGDLVLMCSDGLSSVVSDSLMGAVVRDFATDLNAAAERLVLAANEGGGTDNVSVLLVSPS